MPRADVSHGAVPAQQPLAAGRDARVVRAADVYTASSWLHPNELGAINCYWLDRAALEGAGLRCVDFVMQTKDSMSFVACQDGAQASRCKASLWESCSASPPGLPPLPPSPPLPFSPPSCRVSSRQVCAADLELSCATRQVCAADASLLDGEAAAAAAVARTRRSIRLTMGAEHGFASCAIVGSSGLLLRTRLGAEIDAHDFVMRTNLAWAHGARTQ